MLTRDMMDQSYSINFNMPNYMHYFIGSHYILWYLKQNFLKYLKINIDM